jgi:molybdopterin-guanine dinucleotide biosynthesis protein A
LDVTAFVLAGGQSSRMGSDKALLPWGDETLLTRALATAQAVCSRTVICGPRSPYAKFGELIEDAQTGRGPLAGIHSALHATKTDLNLILSVDLPLMQAQFLAWLLQQADSGGQMITAPEALGLLQPLCAIYHRQVRDTVDAALAEGDLKVTRLFRRVPTRIIGEHQIRAAGFDPSIFANVNTPGEYESLLQTVAAYGMTGPRHE